MIEQDLNVYQMEPYVPNRFSGDLPAPKDLVIPCLMKLEDLIRAHPELEIDQGNLMVTRLRKKQKITSNGHSEGNHTLVTDGRPDSRNSKTGLPKTEPPPPSISKESSPKMKIKIKVRPKKAHNGQPANETIQTGQSKEAIKKSEELDFNAKPGTAGSKQALTATKVMPRNTKNLLAQNVQIQTNNMVDETLVYSLQEICQRAHLDKVPSDAREICKNFRIMLYDLDLKSPSNDEDQNSHAG